MTQRANTPADMATITAHIKYTSRKPLEVGPAFDTIEAVSGARLRWPILD